MIRILFAAAVFIASSTAMARSHYGFNIGLGFPYLSQYGLNYHHSSGRFSADLSQGGFQLKSNDAGVKLRNLELNGRWHPWSRAFFIGLGVGQQSLALDATDTIGGQNVRLDLELTAIALTPKLGWMWGAASGGLFFGVDVGFQMPMNAEYELRSNAPSAIQSTPEYQRLEEAIESARDLYGQSGFSTFTFLRLGYLF